MKKYVLQDWGEDVQKVVDKVQALVELGGEDATLMTAADKEKLDALGVLYGSTAHWEENDIVPQSGVIVIYSDYKTVEIDGQSILVPGMKVGDGKKSLSTIPFVGVKTELQVLNHIADEVRHITQEEREKWNNKINIDESDIEENENLIINRD